MIIKLSCIIITFVLVFTVHAFYSINKIERISEQWTSVEGISPIVSYLQQQEYFLGLSYAMAGAFTVYALFKFLSNRKKGATGILGGITLTGVLYFGGCFLLGCCGSPMLAVYLSLFGSSMLGFTKAITLILTTVSIIIGFVWLEWRGNKTVCDCGPDDECKNSDGIDQ